MNQPKPRPPNTIAIAVRITGSGTDSDLQEGIAHHQALASGWQAPSI
jgi:hypothetical protein